MVSNLLFVHPCLGEDYVLDQTYVSDGWLNRQLAYGLFMVVTISKVLKSSLYVSCLPTKRLQWIVQIPGKAGLFGLRFQQLPFAGEIVLYKILGPISVEVPPNSEEESRLCDFNVCHLYTEIIQ